ncbi:hypothetical protein [Microlunatus soli]|uniref:Integral membrane protein n=1 Tax=Microlunatus soli TaxID=630515 RepID=A0A1H1YY62_9ACTN|nr:hypothetical protein [Microlunatus soli]SDT26348.1 hypothetical protein SAMN04489812_4856 [Microlunatus soli]
MTETPPTSHQLRERIAQLEAENRTLRERSVPTPESLAPSAPPVLSRRGRGWAVLSLCLIIVGCVLAPLSVVTVWARATLVDTDRFVATYAPLANSLVVQDYVIDQSVTVIDQKVDIDLLTANLIDGIKDLGTGPRANAALDALQGPAASGLKNLIRSGVTEFVRSDAFAQTWQQALRISHTQLMATVRDDPQAILKAQQDGTIGIQLGPIIDRVKRSLIDRGITVASRIPSVNKTIPIAQADQIGTVQAGYRVVIALGAWLPWVCLLFLVAGVVVARRRTRALVGTGVGFALAMLVLLLGFFVGRTVVAASLPPSLAPGNVTDLLYTTATHAMRDTAIAGLVLGIAVALVGWFGGPFTSSQRIRGGYLSGVDHLRRRVEDRGVSTGKVGEWIYAQRLLIRIVIAVVVAAIILLNRPLAVSTIVATGLIAIGVLIILSLVERPPRPDPTPESATGNGSAAVASSDV